jgi:preprotein translocase subunit SecA
VALAKALNKILRAGEGKVLRNLQSIAEDVSKLESSYAELSDSDFPGVTRSFQERYWGDSFSKYDDFVSGKISFDVNGEEIPGPGSKQVLRDDTPLEPAGESLDDLLLEAFALVREASKRTLGMVHHDVQVMGGAALFKGNISEMKTGEGKTLVATLPAYLAALSGLGVHIVTVNDYLASYQSELMGRIFRFLGMTTGCIVSGQNPQVRRSQYHADITYGTNNEFGFDYLRDNMALERLSRVQRGHNFAIVDEVDSILIDEARTPLIISGQAGGDFKDNYQKFARFVKGLERATNVDTSTNPLLRLEQEEPNGDYEVDEKKRTVGILSSGIAKLEKQLGIDNLYDPANLDLLQFMNNAIKAKELFARDKDYIVQDGEVKIVDEHTGRVLDGRRYSDGLHQAIEAKENVAIQAENRTLATTTLQNYFRLYKKLSGMTGTAETEAAEFNGTYKLGVVPIPTNKPMIREDKPDLIFKNLRGKYMAIIADVKARNDLGQPVLIGTTSVEKSEEISAELKRAGIKHNVLNAKQHAREAAVIALAGRSKAVTVATNMAGRGTDIMLGGNVEFLAGEKMRALGLDVQEDSKEYEAKWPSVRAGTEAEVQDEHDLVVSLGGLYVLGTERHENRRIDNQLRGRSGRQGDPGESRFYISMEDDLMRLSGTNAVQSMMEFMNFPDDQPLESKMVTKSVQSAQAKIEAMNFEMRKNILKYDDVLSKQREVMYEQRRRVLAGMDMSQQVIGFIEGVLSDVILEATASGAPEEWDLPNAWRELERYYPVTTTLSDVLESVPSAKALTSELITREVVQDAKLHYASRLDSVGAEFFKEYERRVVLMVLDRHWQRHLENMDYLRSGIGLRAMAQKDPIVEYTNESSRMFAAMNAEIRAEIVMSLLKSDGQIIDAKGNLIQFNAKNEVSVMFASGPSEAGTDAQFDSSDDVTFEGVSKNAPCPCGSGKKYKLCHGRGK